MAKEKIKNDPVSLLIQRYEGFIENLQAEEKRLKSSKDCFDADDFAVLADDLRQTTAELETYVEVLRDVKDLQKDLEAAPDQNDPGM